MSNGDDPAVPAPQLPKPPQGQAPLESALKKMSEDRPQVLQEILMGFGTMGNPLQAKMNAEHITQVLSLATAHDERQYTLTKQTNDYEAAHKHSNRRYGFAAFVIICIFTGIILFTFKDKPEILVPTLTGFGGFLTGAAAGFGVGKAKAD